MFTLFIHTFFFQAQIPIDPIYCLGVCHVLFPSYKDVFNMEFAIFFKVELFRRIIFLINTSKAQSDRNNALNDEIYGSTLLQRTSCTLKHLFKLAMASICKA